MPVDIDFILIQSALYQALNLHQARRGVKTNEKSIAYH